MQVYVERFLAFDERETEKAAWRQLNHCLEKNEPCVLLTRLVDGKGEHTVILPNGELMGEPISDVLKSEALRVYSERKNQVLAEGAYFAQVFPRKSQMLIIGAAQALALIPGTSRSGITITAGLMLGLKRQAAARFSFLLSIPVIFLAGSFETLEYLSTASVQDAQPLVTGALISAVSAYACIHYFLKLLERIGMLPFVAYRLALGVVLVFLFI